MRLYNGVRAGGVRAGALRLAVFGGALLLAGSAGAGIATAATPTPSPQPTLRFVTPSPYPPVSICGGPRGIGKVSASIIGIEQQVIFSGCGFVPGSTVSIAANGAFQGTTTARSDTTFATPLRFPTVGVKNLTATGPDAAAGGTASGGSDVGGSVVVPAADVVGTRVVTATVTVVASGAPAAAGTTGSGLPFTGAETGALVAGAVVLVGGGIALRTVTRRRRAT